MVPAEFNEGANKLYNNLQNVFWWNVDLYPRIRQMYFNEFKELGRFANLYMRSAKDPNIAVHELFAARSDKDAEIIKAIYDYYVNGEDDRPNRWLVMTQEMFSRIEKNILDSEALNERDGLSSYEGRYSLMSSNFKFSPDEMSKEEYYRRSSGVHLDFMEKIRLAMIAQNTQGYFFHANEYKDIVMESAYGHNFSYYLSLKKLPCYTLENLKSNTPEEKGFYRTSVLAFRASLGDTSVKEELQADLRKMESIPLLAFFLNMYGEIADSSDVEFLKAIKSKDILYKATQSDIEMAKEIEASGQKWEIRNEISPITETVDRIFKKIGYQEK
jgi:hypothetical protein